MPLENEYCRPFGEMPAVARPTQPGEWPALATSFNGEPGREKLEQYISSIFHASYGATVLEYLPLLFCLRREGDFSAALGLRCAASGPLFCEQYIDEDVEQLVARRYGNACERRRIMEMGNLVSSCPGDSAVLYLLVTAVIHEAGIAYLGFAANRAVRLSIRRCGFTPLVIAPAEQGRLGAGGAHWGSYYQGQPMLMLADVALTMHQALAQPPIARLLSAYQLQIECLVDSLREALP